jgi:hypothetical protein
MSAAGRLVCVAGGPDGGVGKTGAGSVVTGAGALAVLLAAGAAVPVPGVGGLGVAAMVGAVGPEAGVVAGLAVTGTWEVPGAAGVAAPADEATGLVAAGPGGVAVTAGGVAVTAGGAVG